MFRQGAPGPRCVGPVRGARPLSCRSSRDGADRKRGYYEQQKRGERERARARTRKSEGYVIRRLHGERTTRHPSMLYVHLLCLHRRGKRAGTRERVWGGGMDCAIGGTGSCLRDHTGRGDQKT